MGTYVSREDLGGSLRKQRTKLDLRMPKRRGKIRFNSDTGEEAAGIEGVRGIELVFNGFHEGKRITRRPPRIKREEFRGAVENNEGAASFLAVVAQAGQCSAQVVMSAFEAEPSEARRIHQQLPGKGICITSLANEFSDLRKARRKNADFGDSRRTFLGCRGRRNILRAKGLIYSGSNGRRPELLTSIPHQR